MSTKELTLHIITQLILEYRVSIDTISKIFGLDSTELYNDLINTNDKTIKNALIFVLDNETKQEGLVDQNIAKRKVNIFLFKLHSAKTEKEKLEIIKQLNNTSEIKSLIAKEGNLTNEEVDKIIMHRYKYALNRTDVITEYGVSERTQRTRESKMDENMQKRLDFLNDYNQIKSHRRV